MNKGAFGGYKASNDLVSILNELDNKKFSHIVSRCLHEYFIGVIELKKTERGTEGFLRHLKHRKINYINNREDLPIGVRTRVCNIICAKHRETSKEIKERDENVKRR
jgi:hypothetical protein